MAYDTKGKSYLIWRAVWRCVWLLATTGEFGLARPTGSWASRHLGWWRDNLYFSCRRALSEGYGGATSVLLGILGVAAVPLVPIVRATLEYSENIWVRLALAVLIAGIVGYVLVAAACYAAYLSLRSMPPREFSRLVLADHRPTEILKRLAWEVHVSCERFEKAMLPLETTWKDLCAPDEILSDEELFARAVPRIRRDRDSIRDRLDAFKRDLPTFDSALERLLALKNQAASVFNMQPRRFCDHVVQYSPRLQRQVLQKFAENWDYLLLVSPPREGERISDAQLRFVALMRENERILGKTHDRIEIAAQLFEFDALHDFVERVVNPLSTSDATLHYARGVSFIARTALSTRDYGLADRQFRFLRRKQRGHLGFEPHSACVQLCALLERTPSLAGMIRSVAQEIDPSATARTQSRALRRISEKRSIQGDSSQPSVQAATAQENLRALSLLASAAEVYFEWSRRRIAQAFDIRVRAWLENTRPAPVAIVTCEYSKTVRECLKSGLDAITAVAGAEQQRPMIFLLTDRLSDPFTSQYMVYELRDDARFNNRVSVGDPAQVASLLRGCRVVTVLGAETFNRMGELWEAPSVSPLVASFFQQLKQIPDVQSRTLYVTGRYKEHQPPMFAEDRLLQFHLTHLAVVPLDHRPYDIVTDEEVITVNLPSEMLF